MGYSTDGGVGVGSWVGDGTGEEGVSTPKGVGEMTKTVGMNEVTHPAISGGDVGGRRGTRARSTALSQRAPITSAPASRTSSPPESSNRQPDEEVSFIRDS